MHIRDACEADLPGILEIHNEAVLKSTANWNERTVDLEERHAWLALRKGRGYPVLVAVGDDGVVNGYASFGEWRPFDGFRHTVEHSVYVRDGQRGNGIGHTLMAELIVRARQLGMHAMVAAIESGNRASIHLHQQLGFIHIGQFREVGRKFDRWLDLTFMQLTIRE